MNTVKLDNIYQRYRSVFSGNLHPLLYSLLIDEEKKGKICSFVIISRAGKIELGIAEANTPTYSTTLSFAPGVDLKAAQGVKNNLNSEIFGLDVLGASGIEFSFRFAQYQSKRQTQKAA